MASTAGRLRANRTCVWPVSGSRSNVTIAFSSRTRSSDAASAASAGTAPDALSIVIRRKAGARTSRQAVVTGVCRRTPANSWLSSA